MLPLTTRAAVRARRRRSDAALVIDNVVYDVSAFLDTHPGGAEALLDHAGGDASAVFRDVHGPAARALLPALAAAALPPEEHAPVAPEPPPPPPPPGHHKTGSASGGAWYLTLAVITMLVALYLMMT